MKGGLNTKAWKLCSEFNRRKHADEHGYVACVSCGTVHHWKEMDAGHWLPRKSASALYFEKTNIHAQCRKCNRFDADMAKIGYTLYMIKTYGEQHCEKLQWQAKGIRRWRQFEIDDVADQYRTWLKEL